MVMQIEGEFVGMRDIVSGLVRRNGGSFGEVSTERFTCERVVWNWV